MVTDAPPLLSPQVVGVALVVSVTPVDAATVTLDIDAQPLTSFTVTVYVPDARPVLIESVAELPLHRYVNGPLPLVTMACADPLLFPQVVATDVDDTVGPPTELTDALAVAEQPLLCTVTV